MVWWEVDEVEESARGCCLMCVVRCSMRIKSVHIFYIWAAAAGGRALYQDKVLVCQCTMAINVKRRL